jgi:hypothetical protein
LACVRLANKSPWDLKEQKVEPLQEKKVEPRQQKVETKQEKVETKQEVFCVHVRVPKPGMTITKIKHLLEDLDVRATKFEIKYSRVGAWYLLIDYNTRSKGSEVIYVGFSCHLPISITFPSLTPGRRLIN